MAKITNKQTRATGARVLNATEAALESNAAAFVAIDDSLMGDAGAAFTALFTDLTVDEFKARRASWVAAYDAARGVVGGSKRFAELIAAFGIVKAQSDEAKRKQAARAAKKASEASAADGEGDAGEASPKAGAGAAAAAKVKAELTSIEAHVLALFRAGKFEMLTEFIAEHADAQ